jgi:syntaxin 16
MASPFDRSATPTLNPYSDPSLMESDADKSFSQTTLQQTSQKLMGRNDAAIMQREREINDIARGIIELSDIFRELQTMIIDQGTMLDRIDYNVEKMGTEVKAADKELKVVSRKTHSDVDMRLRLNPPGNGIPTTDDEAKDSTAPPAPGRGDVYPTHLQT